MKTTMTEFLEWLENSSAVKNDILNWELVKENALEKEKEQIMDAYADGYSDGVQEPNPNDEYYEQTYNQSK